MPPSAWNGDTPSDTSTTAATETAGPLAHFIEQLGQSGQVGSAGHMPLVSHIAELRYRILISAATIALTTTLGFYWAPDAINALKSLAPHTTKLVQLTMGEVLMTTLVVAVQTGLVLASPVWLYQALRFVQPGLTPREGSMLRWIVLGGALLFIVGMVFHGFFVLPPAIDWLMAFGAPVARPVLSIREFVSFGVSLLLVTGLMFELPMVLFLLSLTGLITSKKLLAEWRWATILIFVVAAIVTPSQRSLFHDRRGLGHGHALPTQHYSHPPVRTLIKLQNYLQSLQEGVKKEGRQFKDRCSV